MKIIIFSYGILLLIISTITATSDKTQSKNLLNNKSSDSQPNKRNKDKFTFTTKLSNTENGSIFSLIKHNINCELNSALSGFSYYSASGLQSNDIAIQFECIKKPLIKTDSQTLKTPIEYISNGKDALDHLDKLTVTCPEGNLIKGFVLQKVETSIHYKYTCVEAPLENCVTKFTKLEKIKINGVTSVANLVRFSIIASEGYGLQKFHTITQGDDLKYEYKECKLNNTKGKKELKNAFGVDKNTNSYKKGTEFCNKKCVENKISESKLCNDNTIGERCKVCEGKKITVDEKDKKINEMCKKLCNFNPKTNGCQFFPLALDIKRKKYTDKDLEKYSK